MKFTVLFIWLTSLCSLSINCSAQLLLPDPGKLYTSDEVPRIDIIIHPDSLHQIYEHPESDREYRAIFVFRNRNSHDTIRNVGFRLRGNTSRYSQKKSFKISFNTFTDGGKFEEVEKLNLNGEHNDPSSSRAIIYWYLLRKMGVAGPRANHVQVFINNNCYGLYTNVEHIDEEFAEAYFGSKEGNLYKCLWPADLVYLGSAQSKYKYMNGDHRAYELKTNEEADNYSDLVTFITTLNLTPGNQLECELEDLFNVQDYLKIAAIDVITGNWDGYIFNKNNFYLYDNPATGAFEYIPYDVDNTFGIDWFGIDWSSRNIYNWASEEARPLYKRLMQVPEYKSQYTFYINKVTELVLSDEFKEFLQSLKIKTRPYLLTDPYYPLDYGYSISSFDQCWESGTGGHVPIGIISYLNLRGDKALDQCNETNMTPAISFISNNSPIGGEDMIIKARVEDDNLNTVVLSYSINGATPVLVYMFDDGTGGDEIAGDGFFTASLTDIEAKSVVEYYIYAYDKQGLKTEKPCSAVKYVFPAQSLPERFLVWPNPAAGDFLYLKEKSSAGLYDLTGRLLFSDPGTDVIDISDFRSGVYVLKLDRNQTVRIVIAR
ncbi:MAG TPA: CotH kinase family protein [Lentimicrobium sp.]|nr:CotH kinase family protein [Lentimicrobium sp.]